MRRERTDSERLQDNALLLSLWAMAQKRSGGESVGDKLKLMKLAFFATYTLFQDSNKALNLRFYKWKRGPMADQVYDTIGDLTTRSLLLDEEEYIVSEGGMRLADDFTREVLGAPENRDILRVFSSVGDECGALSTEEILAKVYAMRIYTLADTGHKHIVNAIPLGTDITRILDEEESDFTIMVTPAWQVTLELAFHPTALRNLRRGIEDSEEGRVYTWEEMLSHV